MKLLGRTQDKREPGQTRLKRKSTCGHCVPVNHKAAPGWEQLVVPGPQPPGVKRPYSIETAVPMYVLTECKDVPAPFPGQASRQTRRGNR